MLVRTRAEMVMGEHRAQRPVDPAFLVQQRIRPPALDRGLRAAKRMLLGHLDAVPGLRIGPVRADTALVAGHVTSREQAVNLRREALGAAD